MILKNSLVYLGVCGRSCRPGAAFVDQVVELGVLEGRDAPLDLKRVNFPQKIHFGY